MSAILAWRRRRFDILESPPLRTCDKNDSPRRAESPDPLRVRPPRCNGAASHSACAPRRTAAPRFRATRCTSSRKGYFLNWQQDPHGNFLARVVFPEKVALFRRGRTWSPTWRCAIRSISSSSPKPRSVSVHLRAGSAQGSRSRISTTLPAPPLLKNWLRELRGRPRMPTIDFLVELNHRLQSEIRYTIRLEPGVQTPEETLDPGLGLLPRQRLVARADPAASRDREPVRVRLSDSARRPT